MHVAGGCDCFVCIIQLFPMLVLHMDAVGPFLGHVTSLCILCVVCHIWCSALLVEIQTFSVPLLQHILGRWLQQLAIF